jgi:signal transduction histidine kinase
MTLAAAAGGYVTTRSLMREMRVSRLQSDFVSAVSHEFRTPLTAVRHLSQLLARGRVSTDERRAEFYDLLVHESDRLHRLVEGLLNFARLEAGELHYRFEDVDPGPYLREIVADFRRDVTGRDVGVALTGDDVALPPIRADREVLGRVFWNLLDNAAKYSPDSPVVRVELEAGAGQVRVRVSDHGLGIPAVEQSLIFEKFVRGAAARAAGIKGTGIGLAMAREIVRAHGGDIAVDSTVGSGSTFTVMLPTAITDTTSS